MIILQAFFHFFLGLVFKIEIIQSKLIDEVILFNVLYQFVKDCLYFSVSLLQDFGHFAEHNVTNVFNCVTFFDSLKLKKVNH